MDEVRTRCVKILEEAPSLTGSELARMLEERLEKGRDASEETGQFCQQFRIDLFEFMEVVVGLMDATAEERQQLLDWIAADAPENPLGNAPLPELPKEQDAPAMTEDQAAAPAKLLAVLPHQQPADETIPAAS